MDGGRKNRRRFLLAAAAALICVIPIIVGVIITSGSVPARASQAGYTPSNLPSSRSPAPASPGSRSRPAGENLPPGPGALVALVNHATPMRAKPGGRVIAPVATRTEFGSPVAMWVVEHTPGWLGVISPLAGNGRVGWIKRDAALLGRVTWELRVSLSHRQLTVLNHGKVQQRFTVAIGAPYAPTPTGRFGVTDRLTTGNPGGPYGCCILALSAKSPHAIQGWAGGNRIAIHSTPETSSIGYAVSHGCMRLTLAEGRWLLDHIPLGTPTLISS